MRALSKELRVVASELISSEEPYVPKMEYCLRKYGAYAPYGECLLCTRYNFTSGSWVIKQDVYRASKDKALENINSIIEKYQAVERRLTSAVKKLNRFMSFSLTANSKEVIAVFNSSPEAFVKAVVEFSDAGYKFDEPHIAGLIYEAELSEVVDKLYFNSKEALENGVMSEKLSEIIVDALFYIKKASDRAEILGMSLLTKQAYIKLIKNKDDDSI